MQYKYQKLYKNKKWITILFRKNKGLTKQNGIEPQKKYKWTQRSKEQAL